MSKSAFDDVRNISFSRGHNPIFLKADGIEVELRDGKIYVQSGEIVTTSTYQKQINPTSPSSIKIGDMVQRGPNRGWFYCETAGGDPFVVAPEDRGYFHWSKALQRSALESAELPNTRQLDAMYRNRNVGGLKGTFNESRYEPSQSDYWSRDEDTNEYAWYQNFGSGRKGSNWKEHRQLMVRYVRKCSIP